MLFDEPTQTRADLRFHLFGFPVQVHPLFWLIMALLGAGSIESSDARNIVCELGIWVIAAFLSILIHELGHAFVLRHYGFSPSITLYGFGGYASHGSRRNPTAKPLGNLASILISAAGPGVQLLLMLSLAGVLYLLGYTILIGRWGPLRFILPADGEMVINPGVTHLVRDLMFVSAFWAYFNLLPVFPLDGGQITRGLFLLTDPRNGIRQSLILSIITGIVMAIVGFFTQDRMMTYFFLALACANAQSLQSHDR